MTNARSIHLASRPKGAPTAENFRLEVHDLPDPSDGEVSLRVIWLSLDPYMRGRMDDGPSYAEPIKVDGVMGGQTVAEVIASKADGFATGDIVTGMTGWTTHATMPADGLRKLNPDQAPVQTSLGVLGMPGMTAWTGISELIGAKEGETIVISAATGAVGAVAGQIAKARGCRVIGVAGGPEKCSFATDTLGYDACIDHYAMDDGKAMAKALSEQAPNGIDGYFENVGGKTTAGVIPNMALNGRIAVCGMVAWYNGANMDQTIPLPLVWRTILTKRVTVRGFIVSDHWDRFDAFLSEVAPLVQSGKLTWREDVTEGLENAPETFMGMLTGDNFGKTLIRVGDDA
ncbi:NADPH-dependent curcumin reductase [Rhodobacteraceae bacterium THAF1]|uniref:NADP-dependent oxidoreductase n=1 Tax=Palleronia sp. THAF1 TaxID=2587842 RepID=UPI000F40BA3A|nr:NADP-dependent oxidoreductase [Palleronia sp. THAF1]QFU09300.1 NADPH-dependent curcumin reductase [Palleronia sp. THAF1]VDC26681.1 NADPH-dependent curcumin reductase [Rhodobacteraceae bacterium THAF1]